MIRLDGAGKPLGKGCAHPDRLTPTLYLQEFIVFYGNIKQVKAQYDFT
jgi:hypothetical protein